MGKVKVILSACGLALSLTASHYSTEAAQRPAETGSESKAPAEQQQASSSQPDRSRRQQAYAKLLEGQRYFANIARADTQNNLQAARTAFREAIALDSTLTEAHTALAEVSFYLQSYDEAVSEGNAAINLDPNSIGAQRVLSRVYTIQSGLRGGKVDPAIAAKAVTHLKEVVRLDKNNAEAWALLSEFYRELGQTADSIEALKRWAAAPPTNDARFYQVFTQGGDLSPEAATARLAETLIAAGRPAEAVEAARRALSMNPNNGEYGELLTRALEAGGGSDAQIISELEKLASQNPSNLSVMRMLARLQARSGRVEEAAQTLKTAMSTLQANDRDGFLLRTELAQLYADAMRYGDAISTYEGILKDSKIGDGGNLTEEDKRLASAILRRIVGLQKEDNQPAAAMNTIGRMRRVLGSDDSAADAEYIGLLREDGKKTEALDVARKARQRFPANAEFARLEGEILTDLGRVDEAVLLFRGRLKGSLNDFGTLLTISNFYMTAGRGKDAVDYANQALALVPKERTDLSTIAFVTLASAQERAGDFKGAETSLRQVLKTDPGNATVLNNLGYFLIEHNQNLDEAVEMIERAVKQEPSNSSYLDSLGWGYFKLGKIGEAERYLTAASRRSRNSATIREHLGDLYSRQERFDLARQNYQRALQLAVDTESTDRLKSKLDRLPSKSR